MQLFYHPDIKKEFVLPKDESRHLVRVLRKVAGDAVLFTDGKGYLFTCELVGASEKKAVLQVRSEQYISPRPVQLCMAVAPTKNADRLEWFTEKAVEIGVERICPIICGHSERKKLKVDRLQRIVVSAMKQSLKVHLPQVEAPLNFKDFVEQVDHPYRFIAHLDQDHPGVDLRSLHIDGDTTVLIGPEGDFTPEELKIASERGFEQVTLGNSRLRTETAAVVACAHLSHQIDKINAS